MVFPDMQPAGRTRRASHESAPARQRPAPAVPEHVASTIPLASDFGWLTPSVVLGLQRAVGNVSVRSLLAARGRSALVQRELEPGWTVSAAFIEPKNERGFGKSFLLKDTGLSVDTATTRMAGNKVQVRAQSDEHFFRGWVNLQDVQDPQQATAEFEAKQLGLESTQAAKRSMSERVEQDVATMIKEQQEVRVHAETGLPSGVARDDVGTVVGRVARPNLAMVEGAEEWPTLLVRMDKCKDTSLHGREVELNLNALATAADTSEKEEEQERRTTNRVLLEDDEVENAVVDGKLGAYTANKGVMLKGKVHYLEDVAFQKAFIDSEIRDRREEQARGNEKLWAKQAELLFLKSNPNGFRDREDIYVRVDRRGFGTEIHEAIHRYSSRSVLENIGFNFNEGVTEYFTRIITDNWIERGDEYYFQLGMITDLVEGSILRTPIWAHVLGGRPARNGTQAAGSIRRSCRVARQVPMPCRTGDKSRPNPTGRGRARRTRDVDSGNAPRQRGRPPPPAGRRAGEEQDDRPLWASRTALAQAGEMDDSRRAGSSAGVDARD